ncbi:hypothetical protein [uncultured Halopseudomonas sp.]|uniref:hypothetical protein n=1 Tax=uncultured Halopseudomonas sp. TaxID=2901193 RepID=UPI0030EF5552|tara:strand:- start:3502 stop:3717 length:216 start_codon:yes stop_codon:yes gene_type:complete
MSVYKLAEKIVIEGIEQAQHAGYGEQDLARALMAEVLNVYKRERSMIDIAHELNFLADNLDEDTDYAFMRP